MPGLASIPRQRQKICRETGVQRIGISPDQGGAKGEHLCLGDAARHVTRLSGAETRQRRDSTVVELCVAGYSSQSRGSEIKSARTAPVASR